MAETEQKKKRGFGSMDPEKQRAIAAKGGKSVPKEKRSFSQDPKLAAAAGSKGGKSVDPSKRSFADKELARRAGSKGGKIGGKNHPKKKPEQVEANP